MAKRPILKEIGEKAGVSIYTASQALAVCAGEVHALTEQAIGADLAARQAGRAEMKIASVDGSPEVVNMLRAGGSRIVATAAQDP